LKEEREIYNIKSWVEQRENALIYGWKQIFPALKISIVWSLVLELKWGCCEEACLG
jgi:hypothetical protein